MSRGRSPALGPYSLLRKLVQGSMATVYLARYGHMRRLVAVKVVRRHDLAARFSREVGVLSRLAPPNVVHARDAGVTAAGRGVICRPW